MNDRFFPGRTWLDMNGKPIQAHGFNVFYKDGTYYWYGENKEFTRPFGFIWTWGIRCYTSKDLYNWEDRGLIIPPDCDDIHSPLHPTYCIDRPHILYCKKTGKYVAWLKIMSGLVGQFMCILQADDFMGPYEYVHKFYQPLNLDSGDFFLAEEADGEKAYIIFERPHFEMITADLTEDYTGVTGKYSVHYPNRKPPLTREAPVYFRHSGRNYLFTSGTTGYYPNPSMVCTFEDFHGEYIDLGNPHQGDSTNTSFNSQITCVLDVPGSDLQIVMADRWLPSKKTAAQQRRMSQRFARQFRNYEPDLSERKTERMAGRKQFHMENTRKSTYVWLPIEWEDSRPVIRWHDEWKIEDYI